MITVPIYLLVGQAALLGLACFVLASAYRRLGQPAGHPHDHDHDHDHEDHAARLVGTSLPDLGTVIGADGTPVAAPRSPGAGEPVLLVYVLPGCETCQAALSRLGPLIRESADPPAVHVLTIGTGSSLDSYGRFGLPVWRAEQNIADIFGLTAYPVFLAVDETGMIRAAGSVHDSDALRAYLVVGSDLGPPPRPSRGEDATSTP